MIDFGGLLEATLEKWQISIPAAVLGGYLLSGIRRAWLRRTAFAILASYGFILLIAHLIVEGCVVDSTEADCWYGPKFVTVASIPFAGLIAAGAWFRTRLRRTRRRTRQV